MWSCEHKGPDHLVYIIIMKKVQIYSKKKVEEFKFVLKIFKYMCRGIYFHGILKLFRDAPRNLQNFSKIIIKIFRNYGWKLMFLSIFHHIFSCFHLNTHFIHEKSVNFLKNSSKLFRKFAKFQNYSVMIITT